MTAGRRVGSVGDLLARAPLQMGMRGDAYLWGELHERFADEPLPDDLWTLRSLLAAGWADAVGQALDDSQTPVYIPRFDPGRGMSAGLVLPTWWWRTGIPILLDRFSAWRAGEYVGGRGD